jgi:hypothetical protein
MANELNKVEKFYSALGRFLVAWADLEVGIDLFVLSVRQNASPTLVGAKIPHQLAGKLHFARERIPKLAILQARKAEIATLLDEIDALSDTRHDFVHGAMIEHRIGRISVTATMGRILQPHGKNRRKPIKVTTKQITETADSVHQLADRMFDLVQELDATPQEISNTA